MFALIASLLLGPILPALAPFGSHGGDDVHWLLVRGSSNGVAELSWQRIGEAYLGRWPWRAVPAESANEEPTSHRLVVGSPGDNPAVVALGAAFGMRWDGEQLWLDGALVERGTGLVLVTHDPDGEGLRTALVHEAIHTLQAPHSERLVDRALHEGLASRLSQLLRPGTSDELALMWTPAKLAVARERRDEILAAFKVLADSTDRSLHTPWMTLGRHPESPAGLPDRCAYYVGWSAVGAWIEAHPQRPLSDLASTSADELLAALH